jgi:hypothetical protein
MVLLRENGDDSRKGGIIAMNHFITLRDDGYLSYLVEGAEFVSKYQLPRILPQEIPVPQALLPFDKRNSSDKQQTVHFYMLDKTFSQVLRNANKYLDALKQFQSVISPDYSLYRDMPLCLQITNTYLNHALAYFFQRQGIKVIPNVRWGDQRSYEFCFEGIPQGQMVAISTLGCINSPENKAFFRLGLEEMLARLYPKIVLVYGRMPQDVFTDLHSSTHFYSFESYTAIKKGEHFYGQRDFGKLSRNK